MGAHEDIDKLVRIAQRLYFETPEKVQQLRQLLLAAGFAEEEERLYLWEEEALKRLGKKRPVPSGGNQWLQQREAILDYVGRLRPAVAVDFDQQWMPFWERLLEDRELAVLLKDKGRQRNTVFNRNLVANIVGRLMDAGWVDRNAARLATLLEGSVEHSVRQNFGMESTSPAARIVERYLKS